MAVTQMPMIGFSFSSASSLSLLHHPVSRLIIPVPLRPFTRKKTLLARASNPKSKDQNKEENKNPFSSQEDLTYLLKLGAVSVGAAAVIKYGSIILPEITRPNLLEALVIISTPVVVAILLLIKESRVKEQK